MTTWDVAPLGDLCSRVESWNPITTSPEKPFEYIDLGAINAAQKNIEAVQTLTGADAPSRARQLVAEGDILVSTVRPNLNSVATVPSQYDGATASTGFTVLRCDPARLDNRFAFNWVRSPVFIADMVRKSTGASYPAVSDRIVKQSSIPLPPLPEQRRIAAILDHADALRTKRRESLARLDELKQSVFIDMFGDPGSNPLNLPRTTIGSMLTSASYGTSEKSGSFGAFPVLRMNNLTYSGELDLQDLKYTDIAPEKIERFTVRDGDILFNRTNSKELVGKTAVVRQSRAFAYAGYLVRLRVNSFNSPEYISQYLNSAYGKAILRGMCKSIVGMANINAKEVQSIQILQPDTSAQQEFEHRVLRIREEKATSQVAIARSDLLFASLQSRAFKGDL